MGLRPEDAEIDLVLREPDQRVVWFPWNLVERAKQLVREIRATFQKKPDGKGLLSVIEHVTDGGQIEERILVKRIVDSEEAGKAEAAKLAGVQSYTWRVID